MLKKKVQQKNTETHQIIFEFLSLFIILGAAYGLAGFIKGLGILAVKQYNVLNELTDAIQDKGNVKRREGSFE